MLKLSTRGRYGLRALIEIARNHEDGPVLMGYIAKKQQFSRKYLHALLTSLKEAGFVKSRRGARGGYLLAMDPVDIRMSDVFEALEGKMSIIDCLTNPNLCDRQGNCESFGLWKRLNDALESVLEGVTLADILKDPGGAVDTTNGDICVLQKKT